MEVNPNQLSEKISDAKKDVFKMLSIIPTLFRWLIVPSTLQALLSQVEKDCLVEGVCLNKLKNEFE